MISAANPLKFESIGVDGLKVDTSYNYVQQFLSTSTIRLQVQALDEPTAVLVDEDDNETTLTVENTASGGEVVVGECFLRSHDTGLTAIYFETGLLPWWLIVGAEVTITDGSNAGNYAITSTAYSEEVNSYVAIFSHNYVASAFQPIYSATIVTGIDVWECTVQVSDLGEGCYRISLNGLESGSFEVSEGLKHIEYGNSFNDFGIIYDTGVSFELDIEAKIFDYSNGAAEEVYTDDEQQEIKLNSEYYRVITFEVEGTPSWMCEKLDLIFSHDYVEIDGVEYTASENGGSEWAESTNLFNYVIDLREVSPQQIDEDTNYILISDDDFLLPNNSGRVPYA